MSNDALHVIGLSGPGDKISLFLKDWELAKVALSCHMALAMLCQEVHEVLSSHRGRAVTEGCGERKQQVEKKRAGVIPVVSNVPLCLCKVSEGRKEARASS